LKMFQYQHTKQTKGFWARHTWHITKKLRNFRSSGIFTISLFGRHLGCNCKSIDCWPPKQLICHSAWKAVWKASSCWCTFPWIFTAFLIHWRNCFSFFFLFTFRLNKQKPCLCCQCILVESRWQIFCCRRRNHWLTSHFDWAVIDYCIHVPSIKSAINETKKLHRITNPVKICFKVNEFSSTRHQHYCITAMPVQSCAANRRCGTVLLFQTEFTSFIQALCFLPCGRSMV